MCEHLMTFNIFNNCWLFIEAWKAYKTQLYKIFIVSFAVASSNYETVYLINDMPTFKFILGPFATETQTHIKS